MTEFDFPSSTTTTTTNNNAKANPIDSYLPGITLSDFVLLSSCFIIIIFYYSLSLLRIFFFFVPLLATTTILLLFAVACCSEGDALLDQRQFEELQVFKIVFEEPMIVEAIRRLDDLDDNLVRSVQVIEQMDDLRAPQGLGESGDQAANGEEGIPVGVPAKIAQERGSEGEEETIEVSQEVNVEAKAACSVESEKLTQCGMEKVQAVPIIGLFTNHVVQESMGESIMSGRGSEAATTSSSSEKENGESDVEDGLGSHVADHYTTRFEVRKEREWRRTLACKLFEDRHSGGVGNEDDMDSLWEVHESKESTTMMGKPEDEDEDEDDDGFVGEKVCCLQALKLSAGRMGRPNITTISKVLKRIGWLRNSRKRAGIAKDSMKPMLG